MSAYRSIIVCLLIMWTSECRGEDSTLIPREVLFGKPAKTSVKVSADGKQIAYIAPAQDGMQHIWVGAAPDDGEFSEASMSDVNAITKDAHRRVFEFWWSYNGHQLLFLSDFDGDEVFHLFSLDLVTHVTRDLTPFSGVVAQNILLSATAPDEVLVGLNLRKAQQFDLYRLNLPTGAIVLDTENPDDVLSWTADSNFRIRAATAFDVTDASTVVRVRRTEKSPWKDVLRIPFREASFLGQVNGGSIILGFSKRGDALFVGTYIGDTTKVIEIDATTGQTKRVIAADEGADVKQEFAERFVVLNNPGTAEVEAVAFENVKTEWQAIDTRLRLDFDALARLHTGTVSINSRDQTDTRWIVSYDSDNGPSAYYWYNRHRKEGKRLFVDMPQLEPYTLSHMEIIRFSARDGLPLVGYLTLPSGMPKKPLPMILIVHGGPWARDHWGFEPFAQLYANRGYAVLQVEYRGSDGFGKKHLNAGNSEIGRAAVDDLMDGARRLIDLGIADPHQLAIFGISMGAYLALRALERYPESFNCAIDLFGPTDLRRLVRTFPPDWAPVKKRWLLRLGDVERDEAWNRSLSAVENAANIRVPLLVGHGSNDRRVPLAASEELVQRLRQLKISVTFVVYSDEGHGLTKPENSLDFFARSEEFLHGCLGGRTEGQAIIPGSTGTLR